ncbi:MAG: BlaI/MecI/CopY family transcriptional regulator [Erysipelothrix sp.]
MTNLSESELFVMQTMWNSNNVMSLKEVSEEISKSERDWKLTTIQTFLQRLVKKGFLSVSKDSGLNLYTVVVARDQYSSNEAFKIIDTIHGGSMNHFVTSLIESEDVTQEDVDKLKEWIMNQ